MPDLVTVFGGSGFLGRAVVAALAPCWTVRVAARHPNRGIDPKAAVWNPGRAGGLGSEYPVRSGERGL